MADDVPPPDGRASPSRSPACRRSTTSTSTSAPGDGPRADGRERRGQVDPDEGPHRASTAPTPARSSSTARRSRSRTRATALGLGISMIHQELSPVPADDGRREHLPRARAAQPVRARRQAPDGRRHRGALRRAGRSTSTRAQVMQNLSVAQTQMVEIAKAISYDARLIIMDEPTSAITEREVDHLHRMIRLAPGERRRDHLHHPQDGRGLQDRGRRHRLPRRQARRDAARRRARPRRS